MAPGREVPRHGQPGAEGLLASLHELAGVAEPAQAADPVLVERGVHAADDRHAQGPADEPGGVIDRRAHPRVRAAMAPMIDSVAGAEVKPSPSP